MEQRGISDSDKAAIKKELKDMPMNDIVGMHRRLHQWAAQGNLLSGFTKEDMEWLHGAVEDELRRRAEDEGREPPEPSPLEWGRSQPEELEEEEEGDDRWMAPTVKKIIAKAKKKGKSSFEGEIERRYLSGELRAVDRDGKRLIMGYAAVFGQVSEDLGGFREIIEPGAFTEAVESDDVRATYNHNPEKVLGRTKAGTLALTEDDIGLRYEITPPDTQYARDLMVSIERGDVNQSSFGFKAMEESWRNPTEQQPLPVRVLRKVKLFDVAPVTFPAYPTTSVAVRDMASKLLASGGRATAGATTDGGDQGAARRLALKRRRLQLTEKEILGGNRLWTPKSCARNGPI